MIAALAAALALLLGSQWLAASAVDLDPTLLVPAAALLLAAAGLGVLWGPPRGVWRLAILTGALALVRGPLCDLVFAALPPTLGVAAVAAVLSLGPLGLCLGRLAAAPLDAGFTALFLGAGLGLGAQLAGGAGLLPAPLALAAEVAALGALARRAATRAEAAAGAPSAAASASLVRRPGHALLVGAALGALALALRRTVPAYVEPSPHPVTDVLLVLLLLAAFVRVPAAALAGGGWPRRLVAAVGGVLLAVAATASATSLGLYENSPAQVALTRQFHLQAVRWTPLASDWLVWLVSFSGVLAAAAGVACGALRGRAAVGLFTLGAALAAGAETWLLADEVRAVTAPGNLVLGAGGAAALSAAVALLPRAGWLLLPVAVVPFLRWPQPGEPPLQWRTPADFTAVRRPGEYGVDAFQRAALADVTVFITPGPDSHAIEGRAAWRATCTDREPVVKLSPEGELVVNLSGGGAHGHEQAAAPDGEPVLARHTGVRLGGIALHAGHQPIGDEGSVGRLTRLLAVSGRAFVTGAGAELIGADLHDARIAESAVVSSPIPIGRMPLHVLLDDLGSEGWQAGSVERPVLAARAAGAGAFDTVVVAPGRESWPGTAALATEEHLARLAGLLSARGRCLLWLDTTDLDATALRARCAAFARVFERNAAAFVEMRELDPPFLLLVGWRDDTARPRADELAARLPWPDTTGYRSRLQSIGDLGAMLLRDGDALSEAGWPASRRDRLVAAGARGARGWDAVASVHDAGSRLSRVVEGAADEPRRADELFLGLEAHAQYEYRLADINETLLEIRPDVDWAAFEREAAHYARAAEEDPAHPLLHLALAALLEPLAVAGDYGRFAKVYQQAGAAAMPSWRLALLEAWVAQSSLEKEMAADALERARRWWKADRP